MSRQALGRGLRSLIPLQEEQVASGETVIEMVELAKVVPNPFQPRRNFDQEALEQLAASIREYGVLEPIILRKMDENYQLVAGERRWRAAGLAGLQHIPSMVKSLTDKQMTEVALIENLQRENLNPVEEAQGYQRLMEEFKLTQEDVANAVGKKRSSVANSLRLLSLDGIVLGYLEKEEISPGHAKVLVGIRDVRKRQKLAERVIKDGLSVRQLEEIIKKPTNVPRGTIRQVNPEVVNIQDELQQVFGTKVRVEYRKGKGKIEIQYFSDEEFERILDMIRHA